MLAAIAESNYYSQLLTEEGGLPFQVKDSTLKTIDTSLHTTLCKVIPTDVMSILAAEDNIFATSGVAVIRELYDSKEALTDRKSLRETYKALMTIHRSPGEEILKYTQRPTKMSTELKGTPYEVSKSLLLEQWRTGLGPEFDDINHAIDVLHVVPKGWDSTKMMTLVKLAVSHLKQVRPTKASKKLPLPPPGNQTPNNNSSTNGNNPGEAGCGSQATNFNKRVRQYIGLCKFITDPTQESLWDRESPYKCFYCRVDDHEYQNCPRMNAMKAKARESPHLLTFSWILSSHLLLPKKLAGTLISNKYQKQRNLKIIRQ